MSGNPSRCLNSSGGSWTPPKRDDVISFRQASPPAERGWCVRSNSPLAGDCILLYEILSLIFQTAVFLYFALFVWRTRPTRPHTFLGSGILMLVIRQIVEVVEHSSGMASDPRDILECIAFVLLMIGLYLYHTRELEEREAVAKRVREAVEGAK